MQELPIAPFAADIGLQILQRAIRFDINFDTVIGPVYVDLIGINALLLGHILADLGLDGILGRSRPDLAIVFGNADLILAVVALLRNLRAQLVILRPADPCSDSRVPWTAVATSSIVVDTVIAGNINAFPTSAGRSAVRHIVADCIVDPVDRRPRGLGWSSRTDCILCSIAHIACSVTRPIEDRTALGFRFCFCVCATLFGRTLGLVGVITATTAATATTNGRVYRHADLPPLIALTFTLTLGLSRCVSMFRSPYLSLYSFSPSLVSYGLLNEPKFPIAIGSAPN